MHTTTGKIPALQLEKEHLQDIHAVGDYELYYLETRKVFNDSTFSFYSQRYSVPPQYIGKTVSLKYRPGNMRLDVYYNDELITQHRTDSGEQYVIKRGHRHSIWRVCRNEKKLFYQQAQKAKQENHPLFKYEQIVTEEAGHAAATC